MFLQTLTSATPTPVRMAGVVTTSFRITFVAVLLNMRAKAAKKVSSGIVYQNENAITNANAGY